MASYRQLQSDPSSRVLFNNRITTLGGLQSALNNGASFVALDSEHVPVHSESDRALHQVGLAFSPTLGHINSFPTRPRVDKFYENSQVLGATFNISLGTQVREDIIRLKGKVPTRRPCRFGLEHHVDLGGLEAAIIHFIQSCSPRTNIVLIGFEMAAEWTYLSTAFPELIPYFSSWADLRDIAKDVAPIGTIPGRVSLLQVFGYHWKGIKGSNKGGSADNAGDDAVTTLAMASALLYPVNQEKLQFRQQCGQIAQSQPRKKGAPVFNENKIAFGAVIESRNGLLPTAIDTSMKLARHFFDYTPVSTGVKSPHVAFITFKDRNKLELFVQETDQKVLTTGETLKVTTMARGTESATESERNIDREQKRLLREARRTEQSESDVSELGDVFSTLGI